MYYFVPVAVETLGAPGEEASAFFCDDLGYCIAAATSEPRSYQFLLRLSVAVQHGNAACVFGTVPVTK